MRTAPVIARWFVLGLATWTSAPLAGQEIEFPPLWLIPKGDTVVVMIPEPPDDHVGFLVERAGAGEEFLLLTPEPVFRIMDPIVGPAMAGSDMDALVMALRAESGGTVVRRLRDPFAGLVTSVLYRSAARITGRLYLDHEVELGARYRYRVVLVDIDGEPTGEVREGEVTAEERPLQAPGAPELTAGVGGVLVTFPVPEYRGDPDDVVFGFLVERAEGEMERFVTLTDIPILRPDSATESYLDTSPHYGVPYRYRMRARDVAGRVSPPSAEVVVIPHDPRPPAAPLGLVTEAGDGVVGLRWNLAPDSRVTGYHVERSTGLDEPYMRITEDPVHTEAPWYVDEEVTGGRQYFYRIVAIAEGFDESRPGNPISAVPVDRTPPEPVEELAVEVTERRLSIAWIPSPSSDVEGYHVYRGEDAERLVRLTTTPHPEPRFLDSGFEGEGLVPGREYLVRVTAVDGSANESEPIDFVVEVPDNEPPTPPTGVQAVNRQGREVELRWSASSALDVVTYRVFRSVDGALGADPETGEGPVHEVEAGRPPYRWIDMVVEVGTTVEYRVIAVDGAGNESTPAVLTVEVRNPAPPPAPRRIVVRSRPGEGIEVRWERVVADDLDGYRVFRSPLPTGRWEAVSPLLAPDGELVFVDADGDGTHYYVVRAVDRSGGLSRASPASRAEGGGG